MKADKLAMELEQILTGEPWYGTAVMKVIEKADPEKTHSKTSGPHSAADILLHMIAWTEETTERLKGKSASDPVRGDWPDSSAYTWIALVTSFKSANELLKSVVVIMDEDLFSREVNDDRYRDAAEKGSYEELIRGIIQHHIYHSGQIALLNK